MSIAGRFRLTCDRCGSTQDYPGLRASQATEEAGRGEWGWLYQPAEGDEPRRDWCPNCSMDADAHHDF